MTKKHNREITYINILIVLLFIVMFIIGYISSQKKLNTIQSEVKTTLIDLEHYIKTAVNTVEYLSTTVQELIKIEDILDTTFASTVHSINNEGEFALDNPHYPNLTGHGGLDKSDKVLKDMKISLELTEYFKVASRLNKDFAWVYYISKYNYLTMYPYIESSKYVWHEKNTLKNVWQYALPEHNPHKSLFFTPLYIDGAGKGLMTTIGKPVYKDDEFRGTLDIDFTVSVLSQFLNRHNVHKGVYILTNEQNEIIASSGLENFNTSKIFYLSELTSIDIKGANDNTWLENYSIEKHNLQIAPWKLYYYKDSWSLYVKALSYMLFVLLIIALLFKLRHLMLHLDNSSQLLKKLAIEDALTGLYNKRYFDSEFHRLFSQLDKDTKNIGLMMLDIDDFKSINDQFGHLIGDKAISQVASILRSTLREDDIICRYGGDEFIVLFPDITLNKISSLAKILREKIYNTPLVVENSSYIFSVSIGVSLVNLEMDKSIEESIHRVDKALYSAKESGKNKVIIFTD